MARLLTTTLVVIVATSGCFSAGVYPRTGTTLQQGEIVGGLQMTLYTFAPGRLGDRRVGAGSRGIAKNHPLYWIFLPLFNGQAFMRFGVMDGVEGGAYFGFQGFEVEGRGRIERGATYDVAATVAAGLHGDMGAYGGWYRAGVDASRKDEPVESTAGLHLSWGPEGHVMRSDRWCDSGASRCYALVMRKQLRLHLPLGVGLRPGSQRVSAARVGVVPYLILATGDVQRAIPEEAAPLFRSRFGIHATVGGAGGTGVEN